MAILFVQGTAIVDNADPYEVAFLNETVVGNVLVVGVTWQANSDIACTGVSDDSGNTYIALTERENLGSSNVWAQLFYAVNGTAFAHRVTADFSLDPGSAQLWLAELSGVFTNGVIENGAIADNVSSLDAGTLVPTTADAALVALMRVGGDRTITIPTDWTEVNARLSRSHMAYRVASVVITPPPVANVLVNWSTTAQTIDGFGASSYANEFPDDVIANADLLFTTTSGVGLSLDRMGLPHNPDTGGRPYKCREIAQLAHARGVTVWASNFYPPAVWKSNGIPIHGGTLLVEHYQDYATLLADEIEDLENTWGVPLYALSIQNEPNESQEWGSCTYTDEEFQAFMPVLYQTFLDRGITTRIMIPETSSWSFFRANGSMANPNLAAMIGILAAHSYVMINGFDSPYYGLKPIWQTEHSIGSDSAHTITTALTQATEIHNFMVTVQANAWHAWNLGVIMGGKRLYTLGNWSKWVRPGWVRITSNQTSDVLTSAFKNATTGAYAIVCVNTQTAARTRSFGFDGCATSSVTPWLTSATENLTAQTPISVVDGKFTATLPAQSVTTFVGTGVTSTSDGSYPAVFTWSSSVGGAAGATVGFKADTTNNPVAPGVDATTLTGTTSPLGFTINMPGEFL